jgi:uncharacterized repeat protein (TIGR03809 family)
LLRNRLRASIAWFRIESRRGSQMAQQARPYEAAAKKWRALAYGRCAHLVELSRSGRWKNYYNEEQFLGHMVEALRAAQTWDRIAANGETSDPLRPPVDTAH